MFLQTYRRCGKRNGQRFMAEALNTGVDYYLADTSDQYFDIQIDVEISNILKDCDMETRMAIRDTARRIAEYGKKIQAKNK